jgi:hypothetical protein
MIMISKGLFLFRARSGLEGIKSFLGESFGDR